MNRLAWCAFILFFLVAGTSWAPSATTQTTNPFRIEGLHVDGDPRWVDGEPQGQPAVHFTLRNSGSTATAYVIEYHWVRSGQATWLRGTQEHSTDGGTLAGDESRPFDQEWGLRPEHQGAGAVRVTVKAGATAGSATSDSWSLFVPVHDMDLAVEGDGGEIHPGETRFFRIHATNEGNLDQTILLDRTGHAEPAGRLADLADLLQHGELVVPPGETRTTTLFLDYEFSGDANPFQAWYDVTVGTAYGRTLAAATPVLNATMGTLDDGSAVWFERTGDGPPYVPFAAPVEDLFHVENVGPSDDTYRIRTQAEPGWTVLVGLDGVAWAAEQRVALTSGQVEDFHLSVEPPAHAVRGTPADVTVRILSDRPMDPVERTWTYRVHGPAVRVEADPHWEASPYLGDEAKAVVRLSNDGDEPTPDSGTLRLTWEAAGSTLNTSDVAIPVLGPAESVVVDVAAGNHSVAGVVTARVEWSEDEDDPVYAPSLTRDVFVRRAEAVVVPAAALHGAPGELVGYRNGQHAFVVRNDGNAEETFVAEAMAEAGSATVASDAVFQLAPGEQRTLAVDQRIPRPSGDLLEVDATLEIRVQARPDLNWSAGVTTAIEDDVPPMVEEPRLPGLWTSGQDLPLTLMADDDSEVSAVWVLHTDHEEIDAVHALAPSNESGRWTVVLPGLHTGDHSFVFGAQDAHGNDVETSSDVVEVRPVPPPALEVTGPAEGAEVVANATFAVRVEDPLGVERVSASARNESNAIVWERAIVPDAGNYSFNLTGTPPGLVTVKVEAVNPAGSRSHQTLNLTVKAPPAPAPSPEPTGGPAAVPPEEVTPVPAVWPVVAVLVGLGLRRMHAWRRSR